MGIEHATQATGTDAGNGEIHKAQWNANHVLVGPRQVVVLVTASASPRVLTLVSPLQTSTFICCFSGVATLSTITAITQTNVTWTLLHRSVNGSNSGVEAWVGIPTGTPGTSVSVAYNANTNEAISVSEWPVSCGLAGTLDQSADATNTNTFQNSGYITGTSDSALCLVLFGCNNGTISMTGPTGPFFPLINPTFAAFGWCWSGKNPIQSNIPVQSSAVNANTIITVV